MVVYRALYGEKKTWVRPITMWNETVEKDGETLFEGEFYESCTNDGVHPNDLGFYRMANKIGKVIVNVLNIK